MYIVIAGGGKIELAALTATGGVDGETLVGPDPLPATAAHSKGPDWQAHVVTDGRLVTGQNPGSSEGVAQALLSLLARDVEAS